jgi:adenylate cyclase
MNDTEKEQRKLAAIMFTDMVGYSALTQKNEALALQLLDEHRKLSRPVFSKHGGREIKTIGDAFMVEFESTLDAVRCSIEMQKVIAEYNAAQAPERRIEHRIGIHVGDVVFRGNDVYGDGVNIAARIEPLAEPGGICISEDVARQIQNKIELPLMRLGRGELKNIKLPVTIYRVELPWKKRQLPFAQRLEFAFRRRRKKLLTALIPFAVLVALYLILKRTFIPAELVSVAVLPLEITGSSSEDNTWLAEGIGQSIANKLTNLKNVQVTPWATSQRYRDRSVSLKDLAKDLGVQRLIHGTIRVLGERVRASLELIDPFGNQTLWADEFEEKASDIFAVQTKIALGCAAGLKGNLSSEEATIMAKPPAERADAFEFYIKGSMKMQSETEEDDNIALAFFDRAIELDPKLAEARVGRGAVYSARFFYGFGGKEALDAAMENYKIALELDPQSTNARRGLIAQLWQMGLSEEPLKQGAAIRKDELNDVGALSVKADAYWVGGLPNKAVPLYEKILQLDRANQSALYFLILSLNQSLQPQKAIDAGETYFERFGEDPVVHMYVAISHHMLGDLDAARIHYERADTLFGEYSNHDVYLYESDLYRQLGDTAKSISLLINFAHILERTLQAYPSNFRMAGILADCYARLGNYDEAERLLAQALQYSYPAHHFLRSAIVLLRAGRPKIARTIFQDILSNGTDVLLELREIQSMGKKLSEMEKEGFFDKQIELDAKYRALY